MKILQILVAFILLPQMHLMEGVDENWNGVKTMMSKEFICRYWLSPLFQFDKNEGGEFFFC